MSEIARLTVTLDEVEPKVLRRIEVPLDTRLSELHLILQAAMGWENYHLYEFRLGHDLAWGRPNPGWPAQRGQSAAKATLAELAARLKRNKTFHYVYDFGDDWLHTIKLDALGQAAPDARYPRLLAAEGRCPPEDCGGPWGYGYRLEALADPDHEDHEEVVEWLGPGFDPTAVDRAAIEKALAKLAKGRRGKPKAAR